ncbi:MAG: molecular chaperone TorD family protein [Caldimicrobium sp.]
MSFKCSCFSSKNITGEELLIEFIKLITGSIKFVAPPYGSFYLEGHLMSKTPLMTTEIYRKVDIIFAKKR